MSIQIRRGRLRGRGIIHIARFRAGLLLRRLLLLLLLRIRRRRGCLARARGCRRRALTPLLGRQRPSRGRRGGRHGAIRPLRVLLRTSYQWLRHATFQQEGVGGAKANLVWWSSCSLEISLRNKVHQSDNTVASGGPCPTLSNRSPIEISMQA
jgi:hypothetical protein